MTYPLFVTFSTPDERTISLALAEIESVQDSLPGNYGRSRVTLKSGDCFYVNETREQFIEAIDRTQ